MPINIIKNKFEHTTQFGRTPASAILKTNCKYHFPELNVSSRNAPAATGTVYCDTPAIDDESTSAQIFAGKDNILTDVYIMKSEEEFACTLSDNIRHRGAMGNILSDRSQVEISNKTKDALRALLIDD